MEGMLRAASATAADAGVGEDELKLPESFSFAWLEALIAEHTQGEDEPLTTKLDRYAVVGAILFSALGVLGALLLRNQLGLRILQVGFVLECLCMATLLASAGWQAWLGYRHQYETFARELDQQLVQYNVIADAVCRYPLHVIAAHLRYVRDRKSRFIYHHGLLSGGIDKLGILPLLLAMYLQFKDWSFGDWKGMLDHVHWIRAFLLTMLLAAYLVSWWGARAKGRLDLYEMVLTEASICSDDVP